MQTRDGLTIGVILTLMFATVPAFAGVPGEWSYSGQLTRADGTPVDGPVEMRFSLHDAETEWCGNIASGELSAVAGGRTNLAESLGTSVVGGSFNTAFGDDSVVSGGEQNQAVGNNAAVAGGRHNRATGEWSSVTGGGHPKAQFGNTAKGKYASVSGGANNTASSKHEWCAAGRCR